MNAELLSALGVTPEAADAILAAHTEELAAARASADAALPAALTGAAVLAPPEAPIQRLTRERIAAMSAAEINASWAAVSAALADLG